MGARKPLGRLISMVLALLVVVAGSGAALAQDGGKRSLTAVGGVTADSSYTSNVEKDSKQPASAKRAWGGSGLTSVIVKLDDASLATYTGGIAGLPATSPAVTGTSLNVSAPASKLYLSHLASEISRFEGAAKATLPQAQVLHRYDVIFGGVAMLVPDDQVAALSKLPGVQAVYTDRLLKPDTERSPQFIGAPNIWRRLGGQGSAGEGVVVGILDTGIWPEHPSFSDPDPLGKSYQAPAAGVRSGLPCEFGSAIPGDEPFTCNNKLLGAYRFMTTYEIVNSLLPGEFRSARDDNGHGTHTASTAAGNRGVDASIFGVDRGTISGVAPRAHVIAYKVCGDAGCYQSDSAAAVQQAIIDGVDVINFSIGGGETPYSDPVSLAFLDAYNAGIFVAASAGNDGPGADTTGHREPWVTTVAASTADRAFKNTLTITGTGGSTLSIRGTSVTASISTPAPVVIPTGDELCLEPAAPGTFTGQIVVCQRGINGRVEKGFNVSQGGAIGMILYNQAPEVTDLETDNHFLPTAHIQFSEGQQVLDFLAANPGATATLTAGEVDTQQADVMASFSSRGGVGQSLGVSKPDITAPGVQILAGHSPQHVDVAGGPQGELFQAIAGTSMSSPHIAGSAALLKALYPDWSPGQIKSALMTTASTDDLVKEDGETPFTPFDAGSGRVNLRRAWNPGITISDDGYDLLNLQSELWNANYPSVYIPTFTGVAVVQRTLKEVTGFVTGWRPRIVYPAGQPRDFKVSLSTNVLDYFELSPNSELTFSITIEGAAVPLDEARHADIVLIGSNGLRAHIPVTIVRRNPPTLAATKTCDPATIAQGSTTTCTITVTNTAFQSADVIINDELPAQLELIPDSVDGGGVTGPNSVATHGTLAPAAPPSVTIAEGLSPAGYLPLSLFGIAPIAGMGDETIANFNVPPFTYAGETYTRIAVDSNGYAVVGGGNAADNNCCDNQNLPDPERPNNVLAPFWTDLNPGAGGAVRIGILEDTTTGNAWLVVDWEAVKEFSTANTASFQIWIGLDGNSPAGQDISFTYGTVTGNGDGGFLTVGAENAFGNSGQTYYFNGTGTLPTSTTELVVGAVPGAPGGSLSLSFQARGVSRGSWTNCAKVTSNAFFGVNTVCTSGEVTRARP